MVLEKRITSHKAERLLRLQNELDDLVAGSGPRRTLRAVGIAAVVSVIGFRILQVTSDVGVGVELGLIFTIAAATAGSIKIWNLLRVRELRRQIEAEYGGEGREPT